MTDKQIAAPILEVQREEVCRPGDEDAAIVCHGKRIERSLLGCKGIRLEAAVTIGWWVSLRSTHPTGIRRLPIANPFAAL